MPIYQYNCATCRKRVDVFFRSISAAEGAAPACPECSGKKLTRVMSTFVRARSTKQRLDDINQAQVQARLQNNDTGSFARWAKEAGREFDEELGTNYRELADRAEAGEDLVDRVDADYTFREHVASKQMELEGSPGGVGSDDPYGQWFLTRRSEGAMPIYEYQCSACSHVTSVLVRSLTATMKAPKCEACGSSKLAKIVSNVAAVFDGSLPDPDKPKRPSYFPPDIDNNRDYLKYIDRKIDDMGIPMPADARKRLNAAREGKPMPDETPPGV